MLTLGKNQQTMNKCCIIFGVCTVVGLAALAQAQYNTYDSDSNSGKFSVFVGPNLQSA